MARRLLVFSILRTRSARKNLLVSSVIVLPCLASGCDRRPKPDSDPSPAPARTREGTATASAPPEVERELEQLEAEAGIESATDPQPPSGDLKTEIESFTTLDACVRNHAERDALIGDAIDALGYDTLTRDACRILQALKVKDPAPCKRILASALRARCESSVATIAGDPSLCPVLGEVGKLGARDPVCVARASRDERLCVAAPTDDRASCRALVLGRVAECGRNEACIRQLERYKSLSQKPEAHAPLTMKLHLELAAEKGTPEPAVKSFDLDDIAAGGAVIRESGDRIRLTLGAPKSPFWAAPHAPLASPKLFLDLSVPAGRIERPTTQLNQAGRTAPALELSLVDLRLDLLLPKVALLSAVTASESKLESSELSTEVGSPIKLVLTSALHDASRSFRVRLEVETFVRDRIGRAAKTTP
jgi:hypothetical protein